MKRNNAAGKEKSAVKTILTPKVWVLHLLPFSALGPKPAQLVDGNKFQNADTRDCPGLEEAEQEEEKHHLPLPMVFSTLFLYGNWFNQADSHQHPVLRTALFS